MKKLLIVFFALILFFCCPEKKKQQTNPTEEQETKSNATIKVDSSHFKTISIEKDSDIPDDVLEFDMDGLEEEFGVV